MAPCSRRPKSKRERATQPACRPWGLAKALRSSPSEASAWTPAASLCRLCHRARKAAASNLRPFALVAGVHNPAADQREVGLESV